MGWLPNSWEQFPPVWGVCQADNAPIRGGEPRRGFAIVLVMEVPAVLEFEIQGSADDPYRLRFERQGDNFTASCTCPAGENMQVCKHRLALLAGDVSALASDNEEAVPLLRNMLAGTPTAPALLAYLNAVTGLADAKAELTGRRHALARLFCAAPYE